jgi:hypothetical protein
MESQALVTVTGFSELPLELQKNIIKLSENNSNLQLVNKECAQKFSIKSPDIFTQNRCNISPHHMTRILLCAAYNRNYEGVKNILKNSDLLNLVENRNPHVYIDKYADRPLILDLHRPLILDLHGIALYNDDEILNEILTQYKISTFESKLDIQKLIDLLINCLSGNSDAIIKYIDQKKYMKKSFDFDEIYDHLEKALRVTIDCDHEKCITILLKNLNSCSMFPYLTCEDILPRQAFDHNNLKAFKLLLALGCDRMHLPNDSEYSKAVLAVKKDIETAKKLTVQDNKQINKQINEQIQENFITKHQLFCIIS